MEFKMLLALMFFRTFYFTQIECASILNLNNADTTKRFLSVQEVAERLAEGIQEAEPSNNLSPGLLSSITGLTSAVAERIRSRAMTAAEGATAVYNNLRQQAISTGSWTRDGITKLLNSLEKTVRGDTVQSGNGQGWQPNNNNFLFAFNV